ncbi:MAG: MFS transporter [bacterium]
MVTRRFPTATPPAAPSRASRRWLILALGVAAQTSTCVFLYGLPALLPLLHSTDAVRSGGLSLARAGVVVAAPSAGLLATLIAWGAAADRFGERRVIVIGLAGAAAAIAVAASVSSLPALLLWLVIAGAAAASVNAASGRLVLGWFAREQRGLAMGIRQTAQPLGVAVAALVLPSVGERAGFAAALAVPAALCAICAVLVWSFAADPQHEVDSQGAGAGRSRSPYRESVLWRIHLASAALVVPQFTVSAFTVAYLVAQRDWSPVAAGRAVFVMQVAGAAGRIGAGVWSDQVGSRLRPMRTLAVASALIMAAVAALDRLASPLVILALGLATVITVADNGLAFTAVAEVAGSRWAGRALGAQNTGQNLAAAATPAVLGAVLQAHGYVAGFAAAAVVPVVAIAVTPVRRAERRPGLATRAA